MAAKKATKKSTTTKQAAPKSSIPSVSTQVKSEKSKRDAKTKRSFLVVCLVILLVIGLVYIFRSLFVAAMVNGEPITRVVVVGELERQSGKQALDTMVTKTLIMQEAKKQNVTVSPEEVASEVKKIEANVSQQGQTLDQVLALQGMDRKALEDQIRIQKSVEKILGKDIQVSDAEVADYINKNKEALGAEVESPTAKETIKSQLRQQKLSEKFQSWIDNLKKQAKVDYYVNY